VLLASDDIRKRRQQILKDRAAGRIDDEESGRRLIEVDPEFGPGWLALGMVKSRAGDLDAAEPLLWEALERAPSNPGYYLPLAVLYQQRGDRALSGLLTALALWKVSFCDEVPQEVASSLRDALDVGEDVDDPALYGEMAEKFAGSGRPPVAGAAEAVPAAE